MNRSQKLLEMLSQTNENRRGKGMPFDQEIPVSKKGKYDVTYEVWSQEALEAGDTDEKGFESKNNKIRTFEDLQDLVKELNSEFYDAEWSSWKIKPKELMGRGSASYGGKTEEDYSTGEVTIKSYHFSGFSEQEAQYIIDNVNA